MPDIVAAPAALREGIVRPDTGLGDITPTGAGVFLTHTGGDLCLARGVKGISLGRLNSFYLFLV